MLLAFQLENKGINFDVGVAVHVVEPKIHHRIKQGALAGFSLGRDERIVKGFVKDSMPTSFVR